MNEMRQPDAKQHANRGDITEIETGSKIPIWRTSVFQNESSYISAITYSAMPTKFGLLIDFDLPNTVASTSRKPEVVY